MEEKNIYDWTGFEQGLEELGISLNETQRQQFQDYYELLTEWNSFMNLTAITEFSQVVAKHFLDSLSLVRAVKAETLRETLIDVGTGAGFPGIPLKIAFPELDICLLDSLCICVPHDIHHRAQVHFCFSHSRTSCVTENMIAYTRQLFLCSFIIFPYDSV